MDKKSIEDLVKWDSYRMGHLDLHVDLTGMTMPFTIFLANRAPPILTEKAVATINDVIALPPSELERVKEMLWEEAIFSFTVSDYGVEAQEGETPLEAHMRDFWINGPADAYALSKVAEVQVVDDHAARFARLVVHTGTANTINIIVKDGRIVDWTEECPSLPELEHDELATAKRRAKIFEANGIDWRKVGKQPKPTAD